MPRELDEMAKQIALGVPCRRQSAVYETQIGPPPFVPPDRHSKAAPGVVKLEQVSVIEHRVLR